MPRTEKPVPPDPIETGFAADDGRIGSTESGQGSPSDAQDGGGAGAAIVDDNEDRPTQDRVARRAYERYEERGREPGRDQEDWYLAEQDVRGPRR
jgi:hypothetical protein